MRLGLKAASGRDAREGKGDLLLAANNNNGMLCAVRKTHYAIRNRYVSE